MTRRKRGLSEEEAKLWEYVTTSVAPLKRRRVRRVKPADESAAAPPSPPQASVDLAPPAPPPPAKRPAARKAKDKSAATALPPYVPPISVPAPAPAIPPLQLLDRHERRRVVRGVKAIDARIDLHGMRQAEAHGALRGFLAHAQMHGHRLVLVITGKGLVERHFHFEEERGVLRRVVPQWLRMPDLRPFVVGFEEAHRDHGGEGALYVRLRRKGQGHGEDDA